MGWVGVLVHMKLICVCQLVFIKIWLLSVHGDWEVGSIFRCWLEQTENSFGNIKLFQIGNFRGLESSSNGCCLKLLKTMLVFLQIF